MSASPRENKNFVIRIIKANNHVISSSSKKSKTTTKARSSSPNYNSRRTISPKSPLSPLKITANSNFPEVFKNIIKKSHINLINEIAKMAPNELILDEIKSLLKAVLHKVNEKKSISETLDELIHNVRLTSSQQFLAYVSLECAKILYRFNDFSESMKFLKITRSSLYYAKFETLNKYRTYKYLSLCLINMRQYEKARKYALKLLKLSLIFQNLKYESYAYDLLGKIYFYLSNISKAQKYHEKMLNCRKTPEIQNIGFLLKNKYLEKINQKKKEPPLTSDEEEDLELLDDFHNNPKKSIAKHFFSHLSNERGVPKENLQDLKENHGENMNKGLKKAVVRILEQCDKKKRQKKLKEFQAGGIKYARLKIHKLLVIINQTYNK